MRVIAIRKGEALLTLSGRAVLHVVDKRRGHCGHRCRGRGILSQIQLRTRLGDRRQTLHLRIRTGQRQRRISRRRCERHRLHGRERRTIRERRLRGADRRARAVVLTLEHDQHRFQRLHLATTRIGGGDCLEHAGSAHRGFACAVQPDVCGLTERVRFEQIPQVKLTDFRRRTTEIELIRHIAGRQHLTIAAFAGRRTIERNRKVANGAGIERTRALQAGGKTRGFNLVRVVRLQELLCGTCDDRDGKHRRRNPAHDLRALRQPCRLFCRDHVRLP